MRPYAELKGKTQALATLRVSHDQLRASHDRLLEVCKMTKATIVAIRLNTADFRGLARDQLSFRIYVILERLFDLDSSATDAIAGAEGETG